MRSFWAALLTFALILGFAAPAHAVVTNIVPLNSQQDPMVGDTVQDNEELYAYVTSPSGGVACLHRASDASGGSCGDAGAYAKTPILPFSAYITPITAGNLAPGEWVMMAGDDSTARPRRSAAASTSSPAPRAPGRSRRRASGS